MKRAPIAVIFMTGLMLSSSALGVTFQEIARFDVASSGNIANPEYIGNNPSAVAWNGRQLYIAGFNASGATNPAGIVEITNAASTGLVTATYGSTFGVFAAPNTRGYSGLDIQGTNLAAAYDDGASDPNGIQSFDANTNTLSWAKDARGGSGVAFDPGAPGGDPALGTGVAWTGFGSGRRSLQNASTGADIWTAANGMIWLSPTQTSNFARDMDFDPDTGDIYVRRSNELDAANRTGDNSTTGNATIVANPVAVVAGQNLSFLSNTVDGDLIILNNRPMTSTGQSFAGAIQVVDPTGAAVSPTFNWLAGAPGDGVGYYDFDFDPATQTLALSDFANRTVHIFDVVPEPTSFALVFGCVCTGLLFRRRRA